MNLQGHAVVMKISILCGMAMVSSDKKTITIQPGEEVGLIINAVGTYNFVIVLFLVSMISLTWICLMLDDGGKLSDD